MNQKIQNTILASLIGDALALGPHWIYDVEELKAKCGDCTTYQDPQTSYHKHKAGEFTHYGDQLLLTLKHIAKHKELNQEEYVKEWSELFTNYDDYVDHATKGTLENIEAEKQISEIGSASFDGSAVGRITPLLLAYQEDEFSTKASEYVALTHNQKEVKQAAAYIATAINKLLFGETMENALQTDDEMITKWITQVKTETDPNVLGLACGVDSVVKTALHILLQNKPLDESLPLAIQMGGDNAARAMIVGALCAARGDSIPQKWIDGLKQKELILLLLA